MTVFGALSKGRQAAKEFSAKQAEKEKLEQEKPPYKHIPTHAAVDALAVAPASWRGDDRVRIVEAHKRRSAMLNSPGHLTPVGMTPLHVATPRSVSSLSNVSYQYPYGPQVIRLPRNYSYSGALGTPTWNDRGEVIYQMEPAPGAKGKGRVAIIDSGIASASSSKANSDDGSSRDLTSSPEDLEVKVAAERLRAVDGRSNRANSHRLHPISRRVSDSTGSSYQLRTPGPAGRPVASRTLTGSAVGGVIPPVPTLSEADYEPDFVAGDSYILSAISTSTPVGSQAAFSSSTAWTVVPLAHDSPSAPAPHPLTIEVSAEESAEEAAFEAPVTSESATVASPAAAAAAKPVTSRKKRLSKSYHRHSETVEAPRDNNDASPAVVPQADPKTVSVQVVTTELPAESGESDEPPTPPGQQPAAVVAPVSVRANKKKLSKTTRPQTVKAQPMEPLKTAKPEKKSRWSFRGKPAIATV